MLRTLSIISLVVLFAASMAGCSSSTAPEPVPATDPSVVEKELFRAVSDFFCEKRAWPGSLEELGALAGPRGSARSLSEDFKDATFSSPRAILLTVAYTSSRGAPRKVSFIAPPRCGSEASGTPDKRDVSVAGGGIVFRLPRGFVLMKGAQMRERWKAPPFPDAAWSADDGRLIAIRFGELELDNSQVSDTLPDMADAYQEAVPTLVWRSKEAIVLRERNVLRLEFESAAAAGPIMNVVYSASFGGKLFAVTITGPLEKEASVSEVARSVQDSLVVQ